MAKEKKRVTSLEKVVEVMLEDEKLKSCEGVCGGLDFVASRISMDGYVDKEDEINLIVRKKKEEE